MTTYVVAETGGYPYASYQGPGSQPGPPNYWWTDSTGNGYSPHGFAYRNCTDFVAWKLNSANGIQFRNNSPHGLYGHARDWGNTARANNFTVDLSPARGSVAWWGAGAHGMSAYGHVAWVSSVNSDQVTVEEYNNPPDGKWHSRTFHKNAVSGYIHFKDLEGTGSGSGNWSIDQSGYWRGKPPDGMVILNGDGGGHRYVAAGGSLFYYNSNDSALNEAFVDQMRQKHGTTAAAWMHNSDIHVIEGSPWASPRRTPDNNTFMRTYGTGDIYEMLYGQAFRMANAGEIGYLNGTGKEVVVPPGSIWPFESNSPPSVPAGTILRTLPSDDPDYEVQGSETYWANNYTVQDCIRTVKGGAVQLAPVSLVQRFSYTGRASGCSFPPNWVLYGPGGVERWYIYGDNLNSSYNRYQYASSFSMHCRLGASLVQVLISGEGINWPAEAQPGLTCPDNSYVKNRQNGEIFRVLNSTLHYVSSQDILACLVNGIPGEPTYIDESILGEIPRGADAHCTDEGRLLKAPGGQVYWIKDGQRHYVGNPTIMHCISMRAQAGNAFPVSQAKIDSYPEGVGSYCPYSAEVRFVRGEGQSQVWRVFSDGSRQHALSLCATDAEDSATELRFRVLVMPAGEVDGHRMREPSTFSASSEACQAVT